MPVCEEAALTAETFGNRSDLVWMTMGWPGCTDCCSIKRDCNGSGYRRRCRMEGALASVVGGLVSCPWLRCRPVWVRRQFGGLRHCFLCWIRVPTGFPLWITKTDSARDNRQYHQKMEGWMKTLYIECKIWEAGDIELWARVWISEKRRILCELTHTVSDVRVDSLSLKQCGMREHG
jgi:hypothetical protein